MERDRAWRDRFGRRAFGIMFLLGALTHVVIVAIHAQLYSGFADAAVLGWVREAWNSIFMSHPAVFGSLLAAFEAATGLLILAGGRRAVIGMCAGLLFTLALVLFGWGYLIWSIPVGAILALVLRDELRRSGRPATDSVSH